MFCSDGETVLENAAQCIEDVFLSPELQPKKKFDYVITVIVNIFLSSKLKGKLSHGSERECVFHILRTHSPIFHDCFASADFTSKLVKCLVWARLDG